MTGVWLPVQAEGPLLIPCLDGKVHEAEGELEVSIVAVSVVTRVPGSASSGRLTRAQSGEMARGCEPTITAF